jgi:hypothetical protein
MNEEDHVRNPGETELYLALLEDHWQEFKKDLEKGYPPDADEVRDTIKVSNKNRRVDFRWYDD